MHDIDFLSMRDEDPNDGIVINVTSRSSSKFGRRLSPFFLGPLAMPGLTISQNVENAWQFSKVYDMHVGVDGEPNAKYFQWRDKGWASTHAYRYPMGKGAVPLYSYYNSEKLDYIEARKKIYFPCYSACVMEQDSWGHWAFLELFELYRSLRGTGRTLYLRDFDVYPRKDKTWKEMIEDRHKKFGHGFCLGILLEQYQY